MNIYIHIPFCERKCNYCRFASIGSTQDFLIKKYVAHLCKEISQPLSPAFVKKGKETISTVYFWWGTPGALGIDELKKIFRSLHNTYTLSKDIEISFETTPNHITRENISAWNDLWINRISMWIQTLNEKSLDAIGRGGKWDIEIALQVLEEWIIQNISVDFIVGLPHVKKWEILQNICYFFMWITFNHI